jgi:hypothetical protein
MNLIVLITEAYYCNRLFIQRSKVLPSRLSPYMEEIIQDHHGGFRHIISTADPMCSLAVHWKKDESKIKLFIGYLEIRRSSDSVRS